MDGGSGAQLGPLRLLTVIENIFTFEGNPGHEIVFVFEGSPLRPEQFQGDKFQVYRGAGYQALPALAFFGRYLRT